MRDERGLITGWAIKLVLVLAVLGILVLDAGSVVANVFKLDSVADETARSLQRSIIHQEVHPRDQRGLKKLGRKLAKDHGARLVAVTVEDGAVVRVRVRREAPTLVFGRFDFLTDVTNATADGRAGTT